MFKYIKVNQKKTFQANEYFFHCMDEDGISFICMASEDTERKLAYSFLADLKKTFYNAFTTIQIMDARSYELEFAETIQKKIKFFNDNPVGFDTKTDEVLSELMGVKDVMVENMEQILERDFKIEVCLAKASDLSRYSITYKNKAKKFNRM